MLAYVHYKLVSISKPNGKGKDMAFQKKPRVKHVDRRCTKFGVVQHRTNKIEALALEKTPEARKAKKAMGDVVYRTGRANLTNWFAPKGKLITAR